MRTSCSTFTINNYVALSVNSVRAEKHTPIHTAVLEVDTYSCCSIRSMCVNEKMRQIKKGVTAKGRKWSQKKRFKNAHDKAYIFGQKTKNSNGPF